jgi:hypothetical protein
VSRGGSLPAARGPGKNTRGVSAGADIVNDSPPAGRIGSRSQKKRQNAPVPPGGSEARPMTQLADVSKCPTLPALREKVEQLSRRKWRMQFGSVFATLEKSPNVPQCPRPRGGCGAFRGFLLRRSSGGCRKRGGDSFWRKSPKWIDGRCDEGGAWTHRRRFLFPALSRTITLP